MAKITLSYQFDSFTDQEEIRELLYASTYRSILWDVDQEIRSKMKHGDDEWLNDEAYRFLDQLRDRIAEARLYDN